ncbi:hypothetical protein DFH11DRAFT_1212274 [Phellopilus nigrolimitatus]|nr:hypothetical protein DFH11DRAFT_1212274 [Phellopilus nigrolimitatus]
MNTGYGNAGSLCEAYRPSYSRSVLEDTQLNAFPLGRGTDMATGSTTTSVSTRSPGTHVHPDDLLDLLDLDNPVYHSLKNEYGSFDPAGSLFDHGHMPWDIGTTQASVKLNEHALRSGEQTHDSASYPPEPWLPLHDSFACTPFPNYVKKRKADDISDLESVEYNPTIHPVSKRSKAHSFSRRPSRRKPEVRTSPEWLSGMGMDSIPSTATNYFETRSELAIPSTASLSWSPTFFASFDSTSSRFSDSPSAPASSVSPESNNEVAHCGSNATAYPPARYPFVPYSALPQGVFTGLDLCAADVAGSSRSASDSPQASYQPPLPAASDGPSPQSLSDSSKGQKYPCAFAHELGCHAVSPCPKDSDRHMLVHLPKGYECFVCNDKLERESSLKKHFLAPKKEKCLERAVSRFHGDEKVKRALAAGTTEAEKTQILQRLFTEWNMALKTHERMFEPFQKKVWWWPNDRMRSGLSRYYLRDDDNHEQKPQGETRSATEVLQEHLAGQRLSRKLKAMRK